MCPLHHLQELALIIIHDLWSVLTVSYNHLIIIIKERHDTNVGGSECELCWIGAP